MAASSCVNSVNSSLIVPRSTFAFIGVDSQQKIGLPQIFRVFNDSCPSAPAPSLHQPLLPPYKVSPIRVDKLRQEVLSHPDQSFVTYVLDGLQSGFRVGFNPASVSLKSATHNMPSAIFQPSVIDDLNLSNIASHLILSNIGICALSFQRLDSHLKPFEHWNSRFILLKTGFGPYLFQPWNTKLALTNIGIGTLSFSTLEVARYPFKHWNLYLILLIIAIRTLSLQTLELASYPFKHWNLHLILFNIGIRTLSFQTLEFAPYLFEHWNLHLILSNIGIRTLSFQKLDSHLKPLEHWNWHLILLNIGIRILSFQTLEFAPYPFEDWIRTLNLSNIGIGILSF